MQPEAKACTWCPPTPQPSPRPDPVPPACALCCRFPLLVDTGGADNFLQRQLRPEALEAAAAKAGFPLTSRMQVRLAGGVVPPLPAAATANALSPRPQCTSAATFSTPNHPQDGYDHSYHFISTFMEDHINFHADALLGAAAKA